MYIWVKPKKLKKEIKKELPGAGEEQTEAGNMKGKDKGEAMTREKMREV